MTIPILIYTDAPDHPTGLGRICRELAAHIHLHLRDIYRVATLGVYGRGSVKFPWTQFTANGPDDALYNLQQIVDDFFGEDRGVFLTITPPSWLFQVSCPEFTGREDLKWKNYSAWMATHPFEHWAYLAIESHGPHNQFGITTQEILRKIDRRLYYSRWGAAIGQNSAITEPDGCYRFIHHGIDTTVWKPAEVEAVRKMRQELGVGPNDLLLGCVATNTRRKLLPLLFESAYALRYQLGSARLKLWLNTSVAVSEYNLLELAVCYGFREKADFILTSSNAKRSDQWLATMYSACDLTCLPTAGEGFGYPVVESLACGTPCVTGTFGAQSELLAGFRDSWLCPPVATHIITNNTHIEPIYDPQQFASRLLMAWTELRHRGTLLREELTAHARAGWDWQVVWPHWERWFLEGAVQIQHREAQRGQQTLQAEVVGSDGETNRVGTDSSPAGQHPPDGDGGGPDSRAPLRLVREADPTGA